jgi:hypothetical protein
MASRKCHGVPDHVDGAFESQTQANPMRIRPSLSTSQPTRREFCLLAEQAQRFVGFATSVGWCSPDVLATGIIMG